LYGSDLRCSCHVDEAGKCRSLRPQPFVVVATSGSFVVHRARLIVSFVPDRLAPPRPKQSRAREEAECGDGNRKPVLNQKRISPRTHRDTEKKNKATWRGLRTSLENPIGIGRQPFRRERSFAATPSSSLRLRGARFAFACLRTSPRERFVTRLEVARRQRDRLSVLTAEYDVIPAFRSLTVAALLGSMERAFSSLSCRSDASRFVRLRYYSDLTAAGH